MAAKRKAKSKYNALYAFLSGHHVTTLVIAASALTALLYLNDNLFGPLYESGPLPVPARAEVDKLREETSMSFDSIRKNIDQNTKATEQLARKAEQDAAETRASRLTRLITQRVTLTSLVDMNPNDTTLKQLLEQTNTQIIQLQTEIAREAGQLLQSPTQQLPQVLK